MPDGGPHFSKLRCHNPREFCEKIQPIPVNSWDWLNFHRLLQSQFPYVGILGKHAAIKANKRLSAF